MTSLYLSSVDVADWDLKPCKEDDERREREEYLRLYTVRDGERVCIRPLLPESWHALGTYLPAIGCPPEVVQGVRDGVRRVIGSEPDFIAARLHEEFSLDVVLVWETGKVATIQFQFDEQEGE